MRFVDANVFLHAFIDSKRSLSESDRKIKQASKAAVERIEKGEKVLTSVVHISEISNVLKAVSSMEKTLEKIESILLSDNIQVAGVEKEDYSAALELAKSLNIKINDCLAAVVMEKKNIKEIYSFDSDFDMIEGIARLEK